MIFLTVKDFQKAVENKINSIGFDNIGSPLVIEAIDLYEINSPYELVSAVDDVDERDWFSGDVIYYSKAIEYLAENDPSLQESIGLAAEMGWCLEDINSENLASLLATEVIVQEWYENKDEIYSDFKYCEVLENEEGIDFDDWIEGNQEIFKKIVDKVNDGKDWFSFLINHTNETVHVFINQDGLNESEVLDRCGWVTQEELDKSEELGYFELDINDLLILADEYKFTIME